MRDKVALYNANGEITRAVAMSLGSYVALENDEIGWVEFSGALHTLGDYRVDVATATLQPKPPRPRRP